VVPVALLRPEQTESSADEGGKSVEELTQDIWDIQTQIESTRGEFEA
jgi:hypothetical protein